MVAYGTFELANFSIGDANDVDLTGQLDGHVLVYDSSYRITYRLIRAKRSILVVMAATTV